MEAQILDSLVALKKSPPSSVRLTSTAWCSKKKHCKNWSLKGGASMNSMVGPLGKSPSCHLPQLYSSSEGFPLLAAPQLLIEASWSICTWTIKHYFRIIACIHNGNTKIWSTIGNELNEKFSLYHFLFLSRNPRRLKTHILNLEFVQKTWDVWRYLLNFFILKTLSKLIGTSFQRSVWI